MNQISKQTRSLASLAVLRNLYSSNKDIHVVIKLFTEQAFIIRNITDPIEEHLIVEYLFEDYGFRVPSAVVRAAIKKSEIIGKEPNNTYYLNSKFSSKDSGTINNEIEQSINDCESIITQLIAFVEYKKGTLSNEEKEILRQTFCSFVLDETYETEFYKYVLSFIMEHETDEAFRVKMNEIKEGLLLHFGLSFKTDSKAASIPIRDLHIYLETEVLFHAAGYNGQLYRDLFEDFYKLVNEINEISIKQKKRRTIYLHYFEETYEEIEKFFNQAERIIEGKDILNSSRQAMSYIVDHCEETYQVQELKASFFTAIQDLGITMDTQANYYSIEHNEYNLDYKIITDNAEYTQQFDSEKILNSLDILNHINIKRANNQRTNFDKIEHIALSAKNVTLTIAQDKKLCKEGEVPLATTLYYLTNRFWIVLNKNIIGTATLASFDILAKTRIALAAQLNDSVTEKYIELKKEIKEGKITQENAQNAIVMLRKQSAKPESISSQDEDISNCLDFLQIESLDSMLNKKKAEEIEKQQKIEEYYAMLNNEQKRRNATEKQNYDKALTKYEKECYEYASKSLNRKLVYGIIILILYLACLAVFVCLTLYANKKDNTLGTICLALITIVEVIVPFSVDAIKVYLNNCVKVIFSRSYRDEYRKEQERGYRNNHPSPKLRIYSFEDVRNLLLAETGR